MREKTVLHHSKKKKKRQKSQENLIKSGRNLIQFGKNPDQTPQQENMCIIASVCCAIKP